MKPRIWGFVFWVGRYFKMQIKKVYIEQFGKIFEKEIIFKPGINIIYGGNESGKSTLEHFLLTMFFGHRSSRKYDINAREKYIPFGKEFSYGRMVFEEKEDSFVVERKIGQKRKDDLFRCYNEATFDQANFDEHLGKALFDLELESFLKTLFVTQNGTRFYSEKDESLNIKLTNLLETGDEDISFTKALETLDLEMKQIKNSRKSGELDILHEKLADLYTRLDQAKSLREKLNLVEKRLLQVTEDYHYNEKIQDAMKNLKVKIHLYEVKDEVFRIISILESIEMIKSESLSEQRILSNEELLYYREKINEFENIQEEIIDISGKLHEKNREIMALDLELEPYLGFRELPENAPIILVRLQGEENLFSEKLKQFSLNSIKHPGLIERQDDLMKLLHQYEASLKKLRPVKKRYIVFYHLVLVSLSMVLMFNNKPIYGVLGFLVSSLTFLLSKGLIQRTKSRKLLNVEKIEARINDLAKTMGIDPLEVIKSKRAIDNLPNKKEKVIIETKLEEIQFKKLSYLKITETKNVEEFIKKETLYKSMITKKIDGQRLCKELEKELATQTEIMNKIKTKLLKNLEDFGYNIEIDQFTHFLDSYEVNIKRKQNLLSQEDSLKYTVRSLIGDKTIKEFKEEMETLEQLGLTHEVDIESSQKKALEYEQESIRIKSELLSLTEEKTFYQGEEPLYIEDEINILLEDEARLERRCLVLQTTKDLMMISYDELRENFIHELNEKVSKIFHMITKKPRPVKVMEHYSMKYEEENRIQPEEYLSKGSIDQLYLSLRLAMVDLIFEGQTVPIFLDEPFASYDVSRLKNILDYFCQHEDKYQLFIFTCHEREMTILKDYGHLITL